MADTRIIHGFHAVLSRLRQGADAVKEIYLDRGRDDRRVRELTTLAETRGVRVMLVDATRLDGMAGQARHQGVVARIAVPALPTCLDDLFEQLSEPALLLVLDGVTDPHN